MTSPFSAAKQAASASSNNEGRYGSMPGQSTSNSPPQDIPFRPRRRSSFGPALDHLIYDVGGANSLDNFARSWTRAAGFHEIARSPAQVFETDDEEAREPSLPEEDEGEDGGDEYDGDEQPHPSFLSESVASGAISHAKATDYGGRMSSLNDSSARHASRLFRERQVSIDTNFEGEPLLVRKVSRQEESGKTVHVNVVVGQSTLPQTIFNSINVLVGVGLLSLPLGIKYAGWIIGMLFFLFSTLVTNYTAKILARCMDTDKAMITYADIAYAAYGHRARIITSVVFLLELVAACVALIVLFADSLHDLIPSISKTEWKVVAALILTPLSFVPLRVLSFSSILGIMCCFSIITIVFIDGLIKQEAPGSLRDPASTYAWPRTYKTIPLSFGLLASSWGGHSVFPNIYRDMRHPSKYSKGVDITYMFTYFLDMGMAVIGYLMFGDGVREEITSNIIRSDGYPHVLSVAMVIMIAIIPITKAPLSARPIISTCEILLGLDARVIADVEDSVGRTSFSRGLLRLGIRILCNILFVIIAVAFPNFDRIMALLGSALCFSICVILPLIFYLKIFKGQLSKSETTMDWILIVVSSAMALSGTIAAFIPKEKLES